jgi:sugar lactone lactonase YvrE
MTQPTTQPRTYVVDQVTVGGALLGESPRWDERSGRLLWVDLWGGQLHSTDPASGETRTREVAPPLSAAVQTGRGTTVVTQGLCVLELTDHGVTHLVDVPEEDCLRANDAAADPVGRLWIGTMYLPGRTGAPGGLWRWEPGDPSPVRILDDVLLANGLAWSPAGDRMYFVDSLRQCITSYSYDAGVLGDPEPYVEVPVEAGLPDGIAVAADGSVWVALAGGGVLHRYDEQGLLVDRVELPVQYPTSCTFGGNGLSDLFVTTGSRQVPLDQRPAAVAAGAGALFRIATDVTGLTAYRVVLP